MASAQDLSNRHESVAGGDGDSQSGRRRPNDENLDATMCPLSRTIGWTDGACVAVGDEASQQPLIDRLTTDGIKHLWVAYSDYNGRTQGKSIPQARFQQTLTRGVTFAQANLGHNVLNLGAPDTIFGADSGDFFAVPD